MLLGQPPLTVTVHDAPLYKPHWKAQAGLFPGNMERTLAAVPTTAGSECPDVVFRAFFPLNLVPWPLSLAAAENRAACTPLVYVFGTTEYGVATPVFLADPAFHWGNMHERVRNGWAVQGQRQMQAVVTV